MIPWQTYYQQNKHLPYNVIMEGYQKLLHEFNEYRTHIITQQSSVTGGGPASAQSSTAGGSTYGVMNFDGNAFATVSSNSTMQYGTNPFTIEFWINFNVDPASVGNWIYEPTVSNSYAIVNYGGYFAWQRSGASPTQFTDWTLNQAGTGNILSLSTWYHVALTRDSGNTVRFYVNGTASTTTTTDANNYLPTSGLKIGKHNFGGLNGKISNLRILNGTALYTGASFSVPSLPLADITNTVLLMKSLSTATVVSDSSTYARTVTNSGVTWTDGPIVYP